MRMLGFVFRFAKHFKNRDTLRLPYSSLVRPHLEYASVIWNPRHKVFINLFERVQHKFLRSAAWVLGNPMAFYDHDYGPILSAFNLRSLSHRRLVADMLFLYKIFHSRIDCADLLCRLNFYAPSRYLRTRPVFYLRLPSYAHHTVDPINRAMREFNDYFLDIDLFSCTFGKFRIMLQREVLDVNAARVTE